MEIKTTEFFKNIKKLPPPGSEEFKQLIDWEIEKITGGITINGVHISPWLYWHLNHWWIRIDDVDEYGNDIRKKSLPDLRDNEWIRAEHLENCRTNRKGYMEIGGRQGGKDLINSSILYQEDKEITIGECSVGDEIYDESGKLTTITGKFPQGVKPVYKITLLDGREVLCGLEHNWFVKDRFTKKKNKTCVKTTKELLEDYKRIRPSWAHRNNSFEYRYSLPNNAPVEYSTKEQLLDPYFLGLWLGDGSNYYSKITSIDKEIIDYLYQYAASLQLQITIDDVDTFMITSGKQGGKQNKKNIVHSFLKEKGLYQNKHIPYEYMYGSVEQRMELLRGLMDSDGSCDVTGSIEFNSSIPKLAEDFYKLCRSLGIVVSKKTRKTSYKKDGKKIPCKDTTKFSLYTDKKVFKLSRKLEKIKCKPKYKDWVGICNIEYIGDFETTCITVDNDSHLFLTDNYTVTHNSEMEASYFGMNAIMFQNSQNVIVCGNDNDLSLLKDKVDFGLKNLWEGINIPRLDKTWRSNQVKLGYKKPNGDDEIWSYIVIRNAKDGHNTEVAAGTTAKSFIMDEVGKYSFASAFQAAEPAFKGKNGWRAVPILVGTGGSFDNGKDAEGFFYNPDSHNFLAIEYPNNKKTGLFLSGIYRQDCKEQTSLGNWLRAEGKITELNTPELDSIIINVANKEKAVAKITQEREALKSNPDRTLYLKQIMYFPLTPEECFLSSQENMFNIEAAKRQQSKLLQQERTGTPVILYQDEDKIKFDFTDKLPISNFPLKPNDNKDAPVIIYEHPIENPPYGLYTAGCILPGEKVLTPLGLKNVEQVSLEDCLISKDGDTVEIKNLQKYLKEEEDCYTIKLSNSFRSTTFTKEHPIYVSDAFGNKGNPIIESRFKFEFKDTEDVKEKQWIKVPNMYRNPLKNKSTIVWDDLSYRKDRLISSPLEEKDFWWFIGVFLGDGWVESKGYKIGAAFNINETITINKYKEIVKKLFNRSCDERVRKNCIELNFSFQQLNIFLLKNFNKTAEHKSIPEEFKYIKDEFKKQLLLGYIASDGCIYHDKKRNYYSLEFVSISLELLEGIQDILFSLGYVSNVSLLRKKGKTTFPNKEKISNTKETYHLRLGHNDTISFTKEFKNIIDQKIQKIDFDNLPKTVKSPKKGCFISECGNYIYFQIKKITKSKYNGWVYNFECGTNTFMCKNITTHNCDPYRQGKSAYSSSLGAVYIYKRMNSLVGEKYQDMFVASYCARPEKKETWEEQARLLIKYYNARTLCENDEISFIDYMISKGDSRFLEKQPQWLKEIVPNTTVAREFGIHRSAEKIRNHLHNCIKKYMEETLISEKDEQGNIIKEILGINRILDPVLLEEIIQFNDDLNTDRLVAAELAIALAMHMDPIYGKIKEENDVRITSLFKNKHKSKLFASASNLFNTQKRKLF